MPTFREWVIELAVMIAIGAGLAALGPFGTFALGSFGARLAYWIPAALLCYAIFRPFTLAAIYVARRLELPELPTLTVGILMAAAPGTFAIAYMGGYRPGNEGNFEELFQLYVQVGLVGVLVTLVFFMLEREPGIATEDITETPFSARAALAEDEPVHFSPFLDRLPAEWRGRLVALQMEDHYIRAHGPGTSTLILLRMDDAEAELIGIDGLRVHRSWWVARWAIKKTLRDGRRTKLQLHGGLEAPVARERIAALRKAGFLE